MALLQELSTLAAAFVRGEWVGLDPMRRPLVRWQGGPWEPVAAELASCALPMGPADVTNPVPALILPTAGAGGRPILLALLLDAVPQPTPPDRLVIEAKEHLVVRCGNGRLEMDGDGAVQLRGRTILSRCSGTHRIKGGSVQIN